MAKNPTRNYAIEYVGKGTSKTTISAIVGAALDAANDPTGDPIGDPGDSDQLLPLIETLPTDETDTSLVYAPDGAGGVTARSDSGSMVPYYIAPGETFTVPEFKQALFAMLIDNAGTLAVDGFLLEVD